MMGDSRRHNAEAASGSIEATIEKEADRGASSLEGIMRIELQAQNGTRWKNFVYKDFGNAIILQNRIEARLSDGFRYPRPLDNKSCLLKSVQPTVVDHFVDDECACCIYVSASITTSVFAFSANRPFRSHFVSQF